MYIEPFGTVIKILKNCPLDNTYEHTIYFDDANAQYNYFASLTKYTLDAQSYQRVQRGSMRVSIKAENLYDCNYLMFRNTSFGTKWFYAFITGVEYVNNTTSQITFELDRMQTWHFDYQLDTCFVEREHSATDNMYEHTLRENLEIGEDYITTYLKEVGTNLSTSELFSLNEPNLYVAVTERIPVDELAPVEFDAIPPQFRNGSANGLTYYDLGSVTLQTAEQLQGKIERIIYLYMHTAVLSVDEIKCFFLAPPAPTMNDKWLSGVDIAPIPNTYSGYTPKNKKLYCYPFCFEQIISNEGAIELHYELCNEATKRKVALKFDATPVIILWVENYAGNHADPTVGIGDSMNKGMGMTVAPYPSISWTFDGWNNLIATKGLSTVIGMAFSGFSGARSMASSLGGSLNAMLTENMAINPITATSGVSSLGGIASSVAQMYEAQKIPNGMAGTSSNPNAWFSVRRAIPQIRRQQIRPEYARIVDDFFTKFGYACKKLKVPNRNVRPHWTFTQTKSCTITGSLPADDANAICRIYDNGITFWRYGNEVGDYSKNNAPV